MSKLLKMVRKAELFLTKDKAKTFTCINAAGVVVTAGVSMRAGMNIQKKIDNGELTKPDILKEMAPVVGSVVLTELAGIGSYKASAKTIADLTLSLNSAKKEYEALEKKVRESVGDEKAEEIKKEALKDVANEKTEELSSMPDITGYFWFKDMFSGAYFYTRESDLYKAWNRVSKLLYVGEVVHLNDFYYDLERRDEICESYRVLKEYGWDGQDNLQRGVYMSLEGSSELPNGAPCRCIRYSCQPEFMGFLSKSR